MKNNEMEEIIYLNYVSLEHYQEIVKINLSRHGYRILKNVTKPRYKNLWIEKLSDKYIEEGKYKFKDQTKGLLIILNGLEYEEGYLELKNDTINVIHNINGVVGERQTWIRKK